MAMSRMGEPIEHRALDLGGLDVDCDECAAAGVGGRHVKPLTGGVDPDGVDADACAGGDVDGPHSLGGRVDDDDVDVPVTGPACVDPLTVRAGRESSHAEGQRVGGDNGLRDGVDHRDGIDSSMTRC